MHVAQDKIRQLAAHCGEKCNRLREIARLYSELEENYKAREIRGDADEWRQLEAFLLGMVEGNANP